MNKDKIIEARNRTYDIYRRSAKKINEFLYNKDTSDINLPSYIMATIGRV